MIAWNIPSRNGFLTAGNHKFMVPAKGRVIIYETWEGGFANASIVVS